MQRAVLAFCRQNEAMTIQQFVPPALSQEFEGTLAFNPDRLKVSGATALGGLACMLGGAFEVLPAEANSYLMFLGAILSIAGVSDFAPKFFQTRGGFGSRDAIPVVLGEMSWQEARDAKSIAEFHHAVCDEKFRVFLRTTDGKWFEFTKSGLVFFRARNGLAPIIYADRKHWDKVHSMFNPRGELWVDLGELRSKRQITSKDLIFETDCDRFKRRKEWISTKAGECDLSGKNQDPFRDNLKVIETLRKHTNLTLTQITGELAKHSINASESRVRHLWAGTYESFEKALQSLPLEDMPN